MGRVFNALLLTVMIAGAAVTYYMKHRAELKAEKVANLQSEIARQKTALATLRAEWSKLAQPGRLQDLVTHYNDHFRLEPFAAAQFATLEEVPLKAIDRDALTKKIAAAAE